MSQPLLTAEKLALSIGNIRITEALDLYIVAGSCWGILGPNGAGKTTLLHTLAGLRPPDTGAIRYSGKAVADYSPRELARERGLLFQTELSGFPGTLFETVLAGRHPYLGRLGWESPQDLEQAAKAIVQTGLKGLEERNVQTLSGGERQRMEIATLLAQQPRIALLDEPSNHLDPGQQIIMLRLLRAHFTSTDRALMMVLHDCNLAMRFCDHLLLLKGNGEHRAGSVKTLATAENLSWLYGHPVTLEQIAAHACLHFR
ncbi:ABC transporter ATP-binding protein [Thiolapillus sp.]|uniref:ABC transporter ATP-binding protein n=1 Tax=Thiolapillus sp. TaxID=2017437 RepID=UPI0025DD4F1C|nr:ABC transporter ATP-binding protein [Thiolapillus sp.]